jgi:DNA-binding LytR/AlgR family response regulator
MTCVIIDDEPRAHHVLEHYISKRDDMVVAGNCHDALAAYTFLQKNRVDLLFLDINMPEIDGFGLLDMLNPKPMVIITTAYTDHAMKGFEYNAIDYLHKPIRFERFITAIEKAAKWKQLAETNNPSTIRIRIDGVMTELLADDIHYTESLGNYIKLVCSSKTHLVLMPTRELEELLPVGKFVRIHKSYIVNAGKIGSTSYDSVTVNGNTLPVGKTYKKYFEEFIRKAKADRLLLLPAIALNVFLLQVIV